MSAILLSGATAVEVAHLVRNGRLKGLAPVCRVETADHVVALSFDDGPDASFTPRALDLLTSFKARATFFVIGRRAMMSPQLIRKVTASGMEIANHTWSHPHLETLTVAQTANEIRKAEQLLDRQGAEAHLFRAPFGRISAKQLDEVTRLGLTPIHWSLAPDRFVGDKGLNAQKAAEDLNSVLRPGDIILAHDSPGPQPQRRDRALTALRLLLSRLQEREFKVTTVSDLLGMGRPVHGKPKSWFWQKGFVCPT